MLVYILEPTSRHIQTIFLRSKCASRSLCALQIWNLNSMCITARNMCVTVLNWSNGLRRTCVWHRGTCAWHRGTCATCYDWSNGRFAFVASQFGSVEHATVCRQPSSSWSPGTDFSYSKILNLILSGPPNPNLVISLRRRNYFMIRAAFSYST
jgi:hypothetical protein